MHTVNNCIKLTDKEVLRAKKIIAKYEQRAVGDEVVKGWKGTIPWYERQLLDNFFTEVKKYDNGKYDDGRWRVHYVTGHYISDQNNVHITFHMNDKRAVEQLLQETGFLPKEVEFLLDQFKNNLVELGKVVEYKIFTPDKIQF